MTNTNETVYLDPDAVDAMFSIRNYVAGQKRGREEARAAAAELRVLADELDPDLDAYADEDEAAVASWERVPYVAESTEAIAAMISRTNETLAAFRASEFIGKAAL